MCSLGTKLLLPQAYVIWIFEHVLLVWLCIICTHVNWGKPSLCLYKLVWMCRHGYAWVGVWHEVSLWEVSISYQLPYLKTCAVVAWAKLAPGILWTFELAIVYLVSTNLSRAHGTELLWWARKHALCNLLSPQIELEAALEWANIKECVPQSFVISVSSYFLVQREEISESRVEELSLALYSSGGGDGDGSFSINIGEIKVNDRLRYLLIRSKI